MPFVHYTTFSQRQVLTMVHHRQIEAASVLQCPAHHARCRYGPAIIRYRYDTGAFHFPHFRKLATFASLRDGANREDVGKLCALGLFDDEASDGRTIVYR